MLITGSLFDLAEWVASSRNGYAHAVGARPKYGQADADTARDHFAGALGEVGAALVLDLFPNLDVDLRAGRRISDLTHRIEVKSSIKWRNLCVGRDEPPDRRYVAAWVVVLEGRRAEVEILGWLDGVDVRARPLTPMRSPAYVVHERELRPLSTLARLVALEQLHDNRRVR